MRCISLSRGAHFLRDTLRSPAVALSPAKMLKSDTPKSGAGYNCSGSVGSSNFPQQQSVNLPYFPESFFPTTAISLYSTNKRKLTWEDDDDDEDDDDEDNDDDEDELGG